MANFGNVIQFRRHLASLPRGFGFRLTSAGSGGFSAFANRSAKNFYEPVKERITLGMKIGDCQLSKFYAYNGLIMTDGFRVEDMNI